ncbi:MAG: N-acetyltransferase [Pseudomonadota bacterium]
MVDDIGIRPSTPNDFSDLVQLYPAAFPCEDLLPLVMDLLQGENSVISRVALNGSDLVGHIAFTPCHVGEDSVKTALLAPLAVEPAWQRKGVGSALMRAGLQELKDDGFAGVFVLGDPTYYVRFGFRPEYDVKPPYALPAEWREAWQCQRLGDAGAAPRGELSLPDVWLRPELWMP